MINGCFAQNTHHCDNCEKDCKYTKKNKQLKNYYKISEDSINTLLQNEFKMSRWLSAALDDPKVCDEMKTDIKNYFDVMWLFKKENRIKDLTFLVESKKP